MCDEIEAVVGLGHKDTRGKDGLRLVLAQSLQLHVFVVSALHREKLVVRA